jgi:uncharacterized protein
VAAADSAFVGRGWAFPAGANATGGIAMVGGVDEIEQAMYLILATTPGERPMRPEFGCPLVDHMFAPLDATTYGQLAFEVQHALQRWEPRVTVEGVDVEPHASDSAAVLITVSYVIRDTYDRRSLVFPFYTIPEHQVVEP